MQIEMQMSSFLRKAQASEKATAANFMQNAAPGQACRCGAIRKNFSFPTLSLMMIPLTSPVGISDISEMKAKGPATRGVLQLPTRSQNECKPNTLLEEGWYVSLAHSPSFLY